MVAVWTYPSGAKDEEWAFVAPYLCLMREEAPTRWAHLLSVVITPANERAQVGELYRQVHGTYALLVSNKFPQGLAGSAGQNPAF